MTESEKSSFSREPDYFPRNRLQSFGLIIAGEAAALALDAKIIGVRIRSVLNVNDELSALGMNNVGMADKLVYRGLQACFSAADFIGNKKG
ncbi:MAG TPA: hypothetical protein VD947_03545 [Patescibacteria group bacterium]|nr:hypothetical protein [Patescibacteria group bacterium]